MDCKPAGVRASVSLGMCLRVSMPLDQARHQALLSRQPFFPHFHGVSQSIACAMSGISRRLLLTPRLNDQLQGVDLELGLCVSTLYMSCHRPTVAAIMALGSDFSAITGMLAVAKEVRSLDPNLRPGQVLGTWPVLVYALHIDRPPH